MASTNAETIEPENASIRADYAQQRARFSVTQWRAAGLAALAVSILFLFHPLGVGADYPNHLARAFIETAIDGSAALQQYYEISYSFVPDFTIELFVPRLMPLFGLYGAGALVVAAAVVMGPLAGMALSRTLHGGAGAWVPLLGFAAVFNRNLEFGFINFLFGLGLGLFCFALWVRLGPGWRRTGVIAIGGAVVAANHILGFLFLGYIALLWEAANYTSGKRGRLHDFLFGLTVRDGLAFLPGLLLIGYAFLIADDVSTYTGTDPIFGQRLAALMSGVGFFNDIGAVAAGTTAVAAALVGLYFGVRTGTIAVHREMAIVCLGVLILIAIMPAHVAGIWGLHLRYGGALIILTAAAISLEKPAPLVGVAAAAVMATLAVNGARHVMRVDAVQSSIAEAMAGLPTGASVLPVTSPNAGFEIAVHSASLAVIEAQGYAPNLFTNISAVGVREHMKPLHFPQGKPVLPETLDAVRLRPLPPVENGRWSRQFYYQWPDNFSHILYTRLPGEPDPVIDGASPVVSGPDFVIYETQQR
ncbi:MAG: hypothetical protein AAGD92_11620 [Pseudomonadota bacterium]